MELSYSQRLEQTLSPAQRLSLYILQLPVGELEGYLLRQANENPMLEVIPPLERVLPVMRDTAEQFHQWKREGVTTNSIVYDGASVQSDYDAWRTPSLAHYVIDQLCQERQVTAELLPYCIFIAESLDRRGYFTEDLQEIADILSISLETAERALHIVQKMQPTGVGAQNLKECLLLQLSQLPHLNEKTLKLLAQDFSCYKQLDFDWMAELLETTEEEARHWWQCIAELNPIPAQGYSTDSQIVYVIPEASVERQGDGFGVRFNRKYCPTVELNGTYCTMLEKSDDQQVVEFLKGHHAKANQILYAVERRRNTLEAVITTVVTRQQSYFKQGNTALRPMTIASIAEELDVHSSTVSRTIRDKYISSPQGIIPLKTLFSPEVSGGAKDEDGVSRVAICAKLKILIDQEDSAHPLSDTKLQMRLQQSSIQISRRTVAKYREELGIAGSTQRKANCKHAKR